MKSEGRVEQKSKFILLATSVAACFVLYWVWHNLRDPFDDSPGDSKCQWRKRNCLTVPKIIREASPKIANKTVEIKLGAQVGVAWVRIPVQAMIYRRLRIGRDGHPHQSENPQYSTVI